MYIDRQASIIISQCGCLNLQLFKSGFEIVVKIKQVENVTRKWV